MFKETAAAYTQVGYTRICMGGGTGGYRGYMYPTFSGRGVQEGTLCESLCVSHCAVNGFVSSQYLVHHRRHFEVDAELHRQPVKLTQCRRYVSTTARRSMPRTSRAAAFCTRCSGASVVAGSPARTTYLSIPSKHKLDYR